MTSPEEEHDPLSECYEKYEKLKAENTKLKANNERLRVEVKRLNKNKTIVLGQCKIFYYFAKSEDSNITDTLLFMDASEYKNVCLGQKVDVVTPEKIYIDDPKLLARIVVTHPDGADMLIANLETIAESWIKANNPEENHKREERDESSIYKATTNNQLVPIDKDLARYAREAAKKDHKEHLPILTEEEKRILRGDGHGNQ